jgi:hypothetical protein
MARTIPPPRPSSHSDARSRPVPTARVERGGVPAIQGPRPRGAGLGSLPNRMAGGHRPRRGQALSATPETGDGSYRPELTVTQGVRVGVADGGC